MALLLALISIAQTPNTTVLLAFEWLLLSIKPVFSDRGDKGRAACPYLVSLSLVSIVLASSEYDPVDDGEDDLVRIELERCEDFSEELTYPDALDCRSRGYIMKLESENEALSRNRV